MLRLYGILKMHKAMATCNSFMICEKNRGDILMRGMTTLKLSGFVYFGLDIIIQACWMFGTGYNTWIFEYSLHNSFLLWCFAEGIFGHSKMLGWFALGGLLTGALLIICFLYASFKRKEKFLIPLILAVLNVVLHTLFYFKNCFALIGLTYKLIGCAIYAYIVYKTFANNVKTGRK